MYVCYCDVLDVFISDYVTNLGVVTVKWGKTNGHSQMGRVSALEKSRKIISRELDLWPEIFVHHVAQ